uniref:Uncharacterized protein n=1 Tax=Oryza barthii TaxID=65489 RepID=A0A0D3GGX8_9ORYZ
MKSHFAQVEHPASSSSSLPTSRAPPCVASPFPSIRWISGRATAPTTSPRSREKDAQEDRSQYTAVEEIELFFHKSGRRISSSNPCIRAEAWGVVVAVALPFFAATGVLLRSPSPSIHYRPTGDIPLVVTAARAASGHLRRQDEHRRVRKSLAHFSPFGCDVGLAAVRRRRRRQARRPVKLCCSCCFLLCRAYDRWSPLH